MEEIIVQLEEQGSKGRAFVGEAENSMASMTYSKAGEDTIIIDHTEVDESLRGKGVGQRLLAALVKMAREKKRKVIPLCPYAKSVFQKDESIRDVLK